jgi:hypothetical protein
MRLFELDSYNIYALVNRIRLSASVSVLEAAEAFVKKLVERFGERT